MYEGNPVDLQMEKVISADAILMIQQEPVRWIIMIQKKITFILK